MRSSIDGFWDDFCDWCEDVGVGDPRVDEGADWKPWLECWEAALDAAEKARTV